MTGRKRSLFDSAGVYTVTTHCRITDLLMVKADLPMITRNITRFTRPKLLLIKPYQVHAGVATTPLALMLVPPGACCLRYLWSLLGHTASRQNDALSGLNAATVVRVALSAIRLVGKATSRDVSRASMLLWYYSVLILLASFSTLLWDSRES